MSKQIRPPQQQDLPGEEKFMIPKPVTEDVNYNGSNKLKDKIAIITGADSGIGKAIAIAFAKEGAHIVCSYLNEHHDADETKFRVNLLDRECILIPGDISNSEQCEKIINMTIKKFNKLDILVNHAGEQDQTNSLEEITNEKLEHIFRVNVFSMFYMTRSALKYLEPASSIINTVSIVAYQGSPLLLDYSATKAAGVGFTRALSQCSTVLKKGIRVNGVAPGPVWTPLIPASFDAQKVAEFGKQVPMERAGEPFFLQVTETQVISQAKSFMSMAAK